MAVLNREIPTEKDKEKPEHWGFEMYLYVVREWVPHSSIRGAWLFGEGGMVSVHSEMAARETWTRAVRAAWRNGTAISAEAAESFGFMKNRCVRNGMWVFAPIPGVSD